MKSSMHYTTWNLWTIMNSRGQKMTWLAKAAMIDRTLLYRMKSGERPITKEVAERIAAAMQLPFEALFLPVIETKHLDTNAMRRERAAD